MDMSEGRTYARWPTKERGSIAFKQRFRPQKTSGMPCVCLGRLVGFVATVQLCSAWLKAPFKAQDAMSLGSASFGAGGLCLGPMSSCRSRVAQEVLRSCTCPTGYTTVASAADCATIAAAMSATCAFKKRPKRAGGEVWRREQLCPGGSNLTRGEPMLSFRGPSSLRWAAGSRPALSSSSSLIRPAVTSKWPFL